MIGLTLFVQALLFELPPPIDVLSWYPPFTILEIALAYSSPVILQVYRYIRVSNAVQRQQTKWLIFGLVSALLFIVLYSLIGSVFQISSQASGFLELGASVISSLAFLIVPLAITMAILRTRLWDIDALISRTLTYLLLTAILVGVYVLLVFGGQTLLVAFWAIRIITVSLSSRPCL